MKELALARTHSPRATLGERGHTGEVVAERGSECVGVGACAGEGEGAREVGAGQRERARVGQLQRAAARRVERGTRGADGEKAVRRRCRAGVGERAAVEHEVRRSARRLPEAARKQAVRQRAHAERAAVHRGRAVVGIRAAEHQCAHAGLAHGSAGGWRR